jgi:hypothetical protein
VARIENAAAVTRVFGRWPTFHDAEILRIHLDRSRPDGPSMMVDIHAFEMTPEVDVRGFYVLRNHCVVSLRFLRISMLELSDFNHQNVLSGLEIGDADPASNDGRSVDVVAGTSNGCAFELKCDGVVVERVEPCDADGRLVHRDSDPG